MELKFGSPPRFPRMKASLLKEWPYDSPYKNSIRLLPDIRTAG
jgi:hypothetical protein